MRNVSQTPPVSTVSSCHTEWTATPSFSFSAREPSVRSTTWMYWYVDSVSKIRPVARLDRPGRDEDERGQHDGEDLPAPAEEERRGQAEEDRAAEHRPLRPDRAG